MMWRVLDPRLLRSTISTILNEFKREFGSLYATLYELSNSRALVDASDLVAKSCR